MPLPTATRARVDKVDSYIRRVSLNADDFQQSVFAKWLVILTAGFVEKAVQDIITEYVGNRSNRQIADFSSKQISRYLSINVEKLDEILGGFSRQWVLDLKSTATSAQLEALNSVKNLRDVFAHGGENGVGWTTALNYWLEVKKLIENINVVVK